MNIEIEATSDGDPSYLNQIAFLGEKMYYKGNGNPVEVYDAETGWKSEDNKTIITVATHKFASDEEKSWWTANSNLKVS